jgi:beta-glucosidase
MSGACRAGVRMGTTMRMTMLSMAAALAWSTLATAQNATPVNARAEHRVAALLEQMTLEEKIDLLGGVNAFDVRGVPRLGLPLMATADGPFGIRRYTRANIVAGGIALAATWNTELARSVGEEMGRDARARGVHFYLAPGVNIYRSPLNGRNFEYLGEDPLLAARMAVPLIQGVQAHGVAATVKHYVANNSEFLRHTSDSVVDERALREIYLPAFDAAVKEAKVAVVMASYNLVNGEHATQSRRMNVDLLKREWGFDGVLMSDWDSTYDTLAAANGGLDLEMPSGKFFNREALLPLIEARKVTLATIDDKVRRILRTAVRFGWLDREQRDSTIPLYNVRGRQVALQTAREGMVLLKNEKGVLPLDANRIKTLAVIGPNAYPAVPHGGGSVTVAPFRTVSFLEGLSERLGASANVHWLRGIQDLRAAANATNFRTTASGPGAGVSVEVFDNASLEGAPTSTRVDAHINLGAPLDFIPLATGEMDRSLIEPARPVSMRWTGFHTPASAGVHDVFVQFGGFARGVGHRLYVDDRLVSDKWDMKHAAVEQLRLDLDSRPHKIVLEYRGEAGALTGSVPFARLGVVRQGTWVDPTVEQRARSADAVVLAVGFDTTTELEDWDRTFALPPGQSELLRKIAAANPNVIVVLTSGGAVDMSGWLEQVPALLQAWYPGQEGGTALAEILFGDVNPSGRLPATFERRFEDNPTAANYYPEPGTKQVFYKEGVFVGYRGYEKNGTTPLFPFGHGLSYTTYAYKDLKIEQRSATTRTGRETLYEVTFTVTNTGQRAGAAVPQVYVEDGHSRIARPAKELKGFAKVMLQPGETRTVTVPLDARAFAYYDVQSKQWRAEAGAFGILVGSSAAQIELRGEAILARRLSF